MKKQSYSNHKQYVWWFHGLLLGLCLALFIGEMIHFIQSMDDVAETLSAGLLLLGSGILLFFLFTIRYYAVRLQDRIIRMEEQQRHIQLTGKPLDHRLHMKQIVALRFAPDDEFEKLCKRAVDEHLSQDEIKKHIHRWRGDYHRV
ncbi:MAG: hypothetical protein RL021_2075 [Bacteroidota bacterium]|jgi:hypothetical protein